MSESSHVTNPTCAGCPYLYVHENNSSIIKQGTKLAPFDRCCTASKRARKFRKNEAKRKIPVWCPNFKSPCALRVYGFISPEARFTHTLFARRDKYGDSPAVHRYGLRFEGTTENTPRVFWKLCRESTVLPTLPVRVDRYEVVEIDDGIKPVCFYLSEKGYRVESYFKTEDARKRSAMKEDNKK